MTLYADIAPEYGAGHKLYFYEPGTTTFKDTYEDVDQTVPNTNPVVCPADGILPRVELNGLYDVVHKDENDITIWTRDNVGSVVTGQWEMWQAGTVYNIPDVVVGSDDNFYVSLTDSNQGNDPTSSPSNWKQIYLWDFFNLSTTYSEGDKVIGSDGIIYYSLSGGNTGVDPTTDVSNTKWRATDQVRLADAAGTVDAITADFSPAVGALKDGLQVRLRSSGPNTISNPTFAPNGLTAKEITKNGGGVLTGGETGSSGQIVELTYSASLDSWEITSGVVGGVGDGQSWTDVTASRAVDTVYTNTGSRPIEVAIMMGWAIESNYSFIVDGIDLDGRPGNNSGGITLTFIQFSAVIPVGSTYELSHNAGSALNIVWMELS